MLCTCLALYLMCQGLNNITTRAPWTLLLQTHHQNHFQVGLDCAQGFTTAQHVCHTSSAPAGALLELQPAGSSRRCVLSVSCWPQHGLLPQRPAGLLALLPAQPPAALKLPAHASAPLWLPKAKKSGKGRREIRDAEWVQAHGVTRCGIVQWVWCLVTVREQLLINP